MRRRGKNLRVPERIWRRYGSTVVTQAREPLELPLDLVGPLLLLRRVVHAGVQSAVPVGAGKGPLHALLALPVRTPEFYIEERACVSF